LCFKELQVSAFPTGRRKLIAHLAFHDLVEEERYQDGRQLGVLVGLTGLGVLIGLVGLVGHLLLVVLAVAVVVAHRPHLLRCWIQYPPLHWMVVEVVLALLDELPVRVDQQQRGRFH